MKKIVYKNTDNSISIITPTGECLSQLIYIIKQNQTISETDAWYHALTQIALKDVPEDLPFWIVDQSDIRVDRDKRDEWEVSPEWGGSIGIGNRSNQFE